MRFDLHMHRLGHCSATLLLVACSAGSSTPAEHKSAPAPVVTPEARTPITGAHGGTITTIAVTADGRAAVTADATGGTRLWPTLDGTREPIVVAAPIAAALAIARDGAGFVLAVTDAADHVVLIRIDNGGVVRARHQLGVAQQIEIVGDSVLALRVDQVIDHVAFDGRLRGTLRPEAGTRMDSILVNGTHVVAILASDKQRHARRIEISTLTWGETSATLPLADIAPAALSPDGGAIIAMGRDNQIASFDFATAKATPACPASTMQPLDHRMHSADGFGGLFGSREGDVPIGIIGDRVACVVDNTFSWFDPVKGTTTTANVGAAPAASRMAAASDRLIIANEHQLIITSPERTDYLGYGLRELTHVRSVPLGLMIGKGDQEPVILDERFRERVRFALPKLRVDWSDLVPVDDRYIITSSTRPGSGDVWGNVYQFAVYDTVKQVMHQVLPQRARTGEVVYEPSTNLVVTTDGTQTQLSRFDHGSHSIVDAVTLVELGAPKQIALLDPELAGGMVALAIRDEGIGGLLVSELHAADVPPRTEVGGKSAARAMKPRRTYRINGVLRGVDRAGRIYVHDLKDAATVGIYANGAIVAALQAAPAAKLRPSHDARSIVVVDNGRLTMFTATGQRVWDIAAWGSSDADWTATGLLYARFTHALARIDIATGALAERQCGWAFGISAMSRDSASNAPSVCDVAP